MSENYRVVALEAISEGDMVDVNLDDDNGKWIVSKSIDEYGSGWSRINCKIDHVFMVGELDLLPEHKVVENMNMRFAARYGGLF